MENMFLNNTSTFVDYQIKRKVGKIRRHNTPPNFCKDLEYLSSWIRAPESFIAARHDDSKSSQYVPSTECLFTVPEARFSKVQAGFSCLRIQVRVSDFSQLFLENKSGPLSLVNPRGARKTPNLKIISTSQPPKVGIGGTRAHRWPLSREVLSLECLHVVFK
jgi:hypothetical protein